MKYTHHIKKLGVDSANFRRIILTLTHFILFTSENYLPAGHHKVFYNYTRMDWSLHFNQGIPLGEVIAVLSTHTTAEFPFSKLLNGICE